MSDDILLELRTNLLIESLTKTDKRDIDRMIAKAFVSNGPQQKKEIKKAIEKEINSSAMKRLVAEIVSSEITKNLKSGKGKEITVDITKRVLLRLYRELAYNYTPVIDRIKI